MSKLRLIKLQDLSEEIHIPVRTLKDYIKKEKLRATKPGREILVYWDSVEEMLKKNELHGGKKKLA